MWLLAPIVPANLLPLRTEGVKCNKEIDLKKMQFGKGRCFADASSLCILGIREAILEVTGLLGAWCIPLI